MTEFSQTIPFS